MIERRTLPLNYFDFLLVLLVGLLAITDLKTPKAEAGLTPKAEFIVELTWPDHALSDIDLWFRAPTGETIWFGGKQSGPYSLDRDDLGQTNDRVLQADGSYKTVFVNREILTMRGWTPGTYTANVQVYSWKDAAPMDATVRLIRLNPFNIVLERQVHLEMSGQEITVASFTLNAGGNMTAVDYDHVGLTR